MLKGCAMECDIEKLGDFTVFMRGRFTFNDTERFTKILDEMTDCGCDRTVIDLEQVNYIDSGGIGMLLHAREKAAENAMDLLLRAPTGQVERMFKMSGFKDLFQISA